MKNKRKILFVGVFLGAISLAFSLSFIHEIYYYDRMQENFSQSKIVLNPYGNAPLSGVFDVTILQNGYFKIKVYWKWEEGIIIEYKKEHPKGNARVDIVWLYLDYKNRVEISFFNTQDELIFQKLYTITTDKFLRDKIDLKVTKNTLDKIYQWLYGFTNTLSFFDQDGNIRWYLDNKDFDSVFTQLKNGNFIIGSKNNKIAYQLQDFYEVSPVWEIIQKYSIPKMYHHELLELKNGNFLTSGNSQIFYSLTDSVYREDTIIEIDRKNGKIINELNLHEILYDIRPNELHNFSVSLWKVNLESNTWDWAHINSLYVDDNNNVIVSMRAIDMVVSINRDTRTLNWVLSHKAWNYESTKEHELLFEQTPENIFPYPLAQHSAILDDHWNLYVFDNGINRFQYDDKYTEGINYSRILKYEINDKKAKLISSYVHPDKIYTPFTGNISILNNRNYLIWYTVNTTGPINLVQINEKNDIVLEIQEWALKRDYRVMNIDITK